MKGSDASTLEAAYAGAWATALDGSEIPASGFKDLILMIAKELAQVIGNNASHPARTFLYGRSVALANMASTPSVDNTNKEFIGVFDSCTDVATDAPLTWVPTETLADESDSFFNDTDLFNYNIHGNHVRHSRTTIYLEGCVWSESDQSTLYDADGECPLPTVCENILVNGVCANAGQVGWVDNASQIGQSQALYQQGIQLLMSGMQGTNVPLASTNTVAG
jgi:hypothetical protein